MAHLFFVTLHPLEDGNGRIARAIGDMALAGSDATQDRFYSLSSQIEAERKDYYDQLENHVLFKAQLWDTINQRPVNERQRLIINRMLEDDFKGDMNTSKYAK
nr:Fic family protein [Desulfopila inferna]